MLSIISVLALIYIFIVILAYLGQTKMLFFTGPLQSGSAILQHFAKDEIVIHHDGIDLHGWYLNRENKKTIIYYGGNAEEISLNLDDFQVFRDYGIVMINYRGYGKSEGSPGQEALFSDALYILDYIKRLRQIDNGDIILFGRSLGSGVAMYVASKRKVKKVILVTPYDSIVNVAKKHYPFLPVRLLLQHPFNSLEYAKNLDIPVLILSAQYDQIIPYANTDRLIKTLSDNARAIVIRNTDHNSIQLNPEYWKSILTFLAD